VVPKPGNASRRRDEGGVGVEAVGWARRVVPVQQHLVEQGLGDDGRHAAAARGLGVGRGHGAGVGRGGDGGVPPQLPLHWPWQPSPQ